MGATLLVCHGAWSGVEEDAPADGRRITPADTFGPFAKRAKSEAGWRYFEITPAMRRT